MKTLQIFNATANKFFNVTFSLEENEVKKITEEGSGFECDVSKPCLSPHGSFCVYFNASSGEYLRLSFTREDDGYLVITLENFVSWSNANSQKIKMI